MKLESPLDEADSYERHDTSILSGTLPVSSIGENDSQIESNIML